MARRVELGLRDTRHQADYVLIAPQAFMDAAQPLLLRQVRLVELCEGQVHRTHARAPGVAQEPGQISATVLPGRVAEDNGGRFVQAVGLMTVEVRRRPARPRDP